MDTAMSGHCFHSLKAIVPGEYALLLDEAGNLDQKKVRARVAIFARLRAQQPPAGNMQKQCDYLMDSIQWYLAYQAHIQQQVQTFQAIRQQYLAATNQLQNTSDAARLFYQAQAQGQTTGADALIPHEASKRRRAMAGGKSKQSKKPRKSRK